MDINFDSGVMTIPGERTKNGRTLDLGLPSVVLEILRVAPRRRGYIFGTRGVGFSSWSTATAALRSRIAVPLAPWTLHDIRRTVATGIAELGIQPHVVEAILNHQSGHKAGVAGIYNKAGYVREIAAALAQWAEHVTAVVEGRESKVVPLRA
jgi:integrase